MALLQRHHAEGIFAAEARFGVVLANAVPVRYAGELIVRARCQRFIPSLADWLCRITRAH